MRTRVFHTENAGLYIESVETGILIDGIHDAASVGFTPMTEEERREPALRTGIFAHLSGLFFTHDHRDHYHSEAVRQFQNRYPDIPVFLPACGESTDFTGRSYRIRDLSILPFQTEHSGRQYGKEPHCSFLITNSVYHEHILAAGDAIFKPEQADMVLRETDKIEMAFVMIYQLIEKSSLEFLHRINPERILLYHCPEPGDNMEDMLAFIRQILKNEPYPGKTIEIPGDRTWIM